MSREAMRLALEALEGSIALTMPKIDLRKEAIAALREAIAQPQQEPVAWKHDCAALLMNGVELWVDHCPHCGKPRTSPPARKPLTVEQVEEVWMAYEKARPKNSSNHESRLQFARVIEADHGIKDTP